MDYIIGIDAGGTKTTAQAYTTTGELICTAKSGFGNLSLQFEQGMAHIVEAVEECMRMVQGECRFLCVGAAGIETGTFKAQARQALRDRFACRVYATNDAALALYALLEGRDGILVISGTGSSCYSKKQGRFKRVGGWGHLINDDGSGYSIGECAIRAITDAADYGLEDTCIRQEVFAYLGIQELPQLVKFVYSAQKSDIASLVPIVEKLADEGDTQAIAILNWAGEALAKMAVQMAKRMQEPAPKIGISGSVVTKTARVFDRFQQALQAHFGEVEIINRAFEPTKGAYYLYLEKEGLL